MIPNMSDVLTDFQITFTYVQVIVLDDGNFEDTEDNVETQIQGVIQIPQDNTLQALELDLSQEYRQVHIKSSVGITPKTDDEIKYNNKNYKVVRVRNFSEYGYFEFIVEEILNGSN